MMTRQKAVAFLSGFEKETLLRWWIAIADWRWPHDLPFFANPVPGARADSIEQQNALLADPVWQSVFIALHEVTTHEERAKALAFSDAIQAFYHQIDATLHLVDSALTNFAMDLNRARDGRS